MSASVRYLRVPGVRYSARRREVSLRGLDMLDEFFYDKVLPKERRVEALVNSFGLPRRVIEDVLAGLLRTNHALLDVASGELRRLDNVDVRKEHRLGDELEIWQDDITGTFLPARMIDRLINPQPNAVSLRPDGERQFQDFLDAPDARIIEALRSVQPAIAEGGPPGFVLDSFSEKERLERCDLYLLIDDVSIDDETMEVIADPGGGIPFWLLLEWNTSLRAGRTGVQDETLVAAMRSKRESRAARAESVLVTARLDAQLARWLSIVRDITVGGQKSEAFDLLNDRRAVLLKRLRSSDSIRLLPAGGARSHLSELWERASAYMIVVTRSDERKDAIRAETIGRSGGNAQLILVCAGGREAAGRDMLVHPIRARVSPEMILIDGVEARLGDLDAFFRSDPVLQLRGASALSPLANTLLQQMSYESGGWWLRRQLQFHRSEGAASEAESQTQTVARMLDTLCAEIIQDQADGQAQRGQEFWSRAQALEYPIESAAAAAGVSIVPVPGVAQHEVFVEALEAAVEAPQPGSIDVIVSEAPSNLDSGSWLPLFERANAAGTRIRLLVTPGADAETRQAIERLRARINSSLLTVAASTMPLPPALIVDRRVVVIGGDSWFQRSLRANCAFAVESPALADELRLRAGIWDLS